MAGKLKITQVRSKIGGNRKQRDGLRSLGLRKIGSTVVREDNRAIRGQIDIVAHLVNVEEVDA
ncbi:50S ribosomal protein L30 [Streptomonospora litoralis]|uniref:Large ribosomal subunit protein uL30 n=1 Tax=Streptomonospora litoralis TaxID=2498135 RepID=A0A4P6Q9X5_9ACTN|nr:50S ribosomal protein L30 [Streptomonospora litoralis]QBI55947.1 50S ribosomal protein L30 [Streptomonospora litoralis]